MSNPQKFRKRPVVIEAMQVTLDNRYEVAEWCGGMPTADPGQIVLSLRTLESAGGWNYADDGDWIIKGVQGEFYACKPDIFAATYEPAVDDGGQAPQDEVCSTCGEPVGYLTARTGWEGGWLHRVATTDGHHAAVDGGQA
jgi:hypothetical protein